MRIVQAHFPYTRTSGEDAGAAVRAAMLCSQGYEVLECPISNAEAVTAGFLGIAGALAWGNASCCESSS